MNLDQLSVNTIRVLSAEAIEKANSGHPGLPLGAAPMAYTLWAKNMKHNPKNPNWTNRDRFILSAGHGSMLIYSLLHLFGYGLNIEDLKSFRQLDSKTPGHPEYKHTVGVETTTGPLGQGIANGVGMAMAEAHLAARFNRPKYDIVDHYTYVLAGDGCMMEGVTYEAVSLAGSLGLEKLIVLYDSNKITIEGNTDLAFTEDVAKRFEACGWDVYEVEDGNDMGKIQVTIDEAKKDHSKPTLIIIKTEIGYGCPAKQGKNSAHGSPLGEDNIKEMKKFLGWEEKGEFIVPDAVKKHMTDISKRAENEEKTWQEKLREYKSDYPQLAEEFEKWNNNEIPIDYLDSKEFWSFDEGMATRAASGKVINRLAKKIPNLIGGSADLSPSTKTNIDSEEDFSSNNYEGRNIHFGVREHAMGSILNGMSLHGGLKVFGATFFVFSDYMKPSMRLSALMNIPVTYVLTHDSIGVGEDGPTHQPIEQLAMLRSIPNLTVFRPADPKETAAGWYTALTRKEGPTVLVLTRQKLSLLDNTGKKAIKGAYILAEEKYETPDIILMASGSEVELIYEASKVLADKGIKARVVSMPSWELFEKQSDEYKSSVLPKSVTKRLAVEAGSSLGWHKYVGLDGDVISIDHFGASGPGKLLFERFGFTIDNIVDKVLNILDN